MKQSTKHSPLRHIDGTDGGVSKKRVLNAAQCGFLVAAVGTSVCRTPPGPFESVRLSKDAADEILKRPRYLIPGVSPTVNRLVLYLEKQHGKQMEKRKLERTEELSYVA
jgi:hypothetical protein